MPVEFIIEKDSPKVSIIIPSLDGSREGNVSRLVEDIRKQSFQDYELILVKGESPNGHARNVGVRKAKGEILDILAAYGREIGLAYQLADDLVDLENGEMIDSVIIPLLTRLENKSFDSNSLKVKAIQRKLSKNSDKIKELYLDEIKRHLKRAEHLSRSDVIPPSEYADFLHEAPSYIINRMLKEINVTV